MIGKCLSVMTRVRLSGLALSVLLSLTVSTTAVAEVAVIENRSDFPITVIEKRFDSPPHQLVQEITIKVLAALDRGLDPVNEPEKFVQELSAILDPVVAFDYIAKGVMGIYARQATEDEIRRFASVFKLGLVNTYGKGMANFGDLEVIVVGPDGVLTDQRRVTVVQEIRGAANASQVFYSMAKNRKGEWKMINVMLNGINLGETFRSQFAAAVEKNSGNVSKTINEWGQG